MKHTTGVMQEVRDIPRPKLWSKIKKSLTGLGICAVAIVGATKWTWPYYVVLPVFGVGAHVFSEELVRKAIKFMLAVFKDALRAVRGEKDAPPDEALRSGTHPKIEP